MSFGHLVVNLKGFAGSLLRLPPCLHRWQRAYQFRAESIVTVSQSHVSRSISRVFVDGALEKTDRLLQIVDCTSVPIQEAPLQIVVKCLAVDRTISCQACSLGRYNLELNLSDDCLSDFALQRQYIA